MALNNLTVGIAITVVAAAAIVAGLMVQPPVQPAEGREPAAAVQLGG